MSTQLRGHALMFTPFMVEAEPKVRRALASQFGPDVGREAAIEAFEYAWEHWDRVRPMTNRAGYVYRVGVRRAIRLRKQDRTVTSTEQGHAEPWVEPALDGALGSLTLKQRTAVLLVHGFEWTYQETADLLGVKRATVQSHVDRAMTKLRDALEVHDDAR